MAAAAFLAGALATGAFTVAAFAAVGFLTVCGRALPWLPVKRLPLAVFLSPLPRVIP